MIKLEGHSFKTELEQVLMLFFQERVSAYSRMEQAGKEVSVFTKINEAEYTFSALCDSDADRANAVRHSAYGAARQLSDAKTPWGILTGVRPAKLIRQMLDRGMKREQITKTMREQYLASDEKINLAFEVAEIEKELLVRNPKDVSVYIGIPFCPGRCSYCSFISHDAAKMQSLTDEYLKKLREEMLCIRDIIKSLELNLRSVYIGGGTPTALDEPQLKALLDAVSEAFSTDCEYTIEAGRPDTVTRGKLKLIKESGAGRISINPQTVHDKTLRLIGRGHTYAEFLSAFSLAREMGFDNINCDIIAGLPEESADDFRQTMDTVAGLGAESITVHTLYIKRASALSARGDEHTAAEMVSYALARAKSAGYLPYYLYRQKNTAGNLENVGYSKPDRQCLYNIYTMSDSATVLAAGAGGATKLCGGGHIERIFNFKNADEYIRRFDRVIARKEAIYNYFKQGESML